MSTEDMLLRVRGPGRYLGCEVNAVQKDPRAVAGRVALAYPDRYELAMSYLGLQVLYQAVNLQEDLWAERVFMPAMDMQAELARAGRPLESLESRTPLSGFDLVGFTLQHELNYPDVLAMLQMGGIPALAEERSDRHPFVVAGGPGAANPEPLAPALDAAFIGDGEEGLLEMARVVSRGRARKTPRHKILDELARVAGVYIPALGAAKVVRRRLLADLGRAAPPTRPVLPCSSTVHERYAVEIQRGCTRGCRFCQAGMINRPVRQRPAKGILEAVSAGLENTGYGQVSFLSLSAGDHPRILQILEGFYNQHAARRISASLPSLRAETLTPALIELVKTVRKSGFTIAPEAGSDRLRRVINKPLTDADVVSAARGAFSAGWRLIKLYFMVGLPTETPGDREAIVDLVGRLHADLKADGHRPRINVGLSTFVPKPHTPFQWEPMVSCAEAAEMLMDLRRELTRLPGVKTTWTRPEMSWAEGLLSRGDRRLFPGLLQLCQDGRRLQGWTEHFELGHFKKPFEELDLPGGAEAYLAGRPTDAVLPWDHLDLGPSRDFLLAERDRAHSGILTGDCSTGACEDCGACEEEDARVRLDDSRFDPPASGESRPEGRPARIRLTLTKRGRWRHLSHIDFMLTLRRALRRAGWPLENSRGFHPKPRISFGPACPVGVESLAELADVSVSGPFDLQDLLGALSANLPAGIDLLAGEALPADASGILNRGVVARYRFILADRVTRADAEAGIRALLERREWVVSRMTKGRHRNVDVRASLRSLDLAAPADRLEAVCELNLDSAAAARPAEVAREAFGLSNIPTIREAVLVQPEGK